MSSAAEGWYTDPLTGANLRWWSGSSWTNEVAPLPHDWHEASRVDLFSAHPAAVPAVEAASKSAAETGSRSLDPGLDHMRPTRRELRVRRGVDSDVNDAPKHLAPMVPARCDLADSGASISLR